MLKRWTLQHADRKSVYAISTAIIILLIALVVILALVGQTMEDKNRTAGAYSDLSERFGEAPAVEYKGALYRPYEELTNILMIGVDRYSTQTNPGTSYRNGGQADYLQLLVINDDTRTITPILIDRDTMTKITILGVLGDETGTRVVQICLSHGFGDGKELSCTLTARAVSWLLHDMDVDYYVSMDMDGIPALNDALGGVTVTLEDDFSLLDPTMTQGKTLTLQGMQAEYFVRGRMYIGAGTNQARMSRQQIFMDALGRKLSEQIHQSENAAFINNLLDVLDPYLLTDMSRGRMINEAWRTREYVQLEPLHLAGEYASGTSGFKEFHVDEDKLRDLIMQVFYYPVEPEPQS